MTNPTNTADVRAALIEARDWFESQAKTVSKGCGSSYELHDLRVQRDALDAALAAPAQAATAKQSPHPEYDKGFSDGWNRCEERQAAAQSVSIEQEAMQMLWNDQQQEEKEHYRNVARGAERIK